MLMKKVLGIILVTATLAVNADGFQGNLLNLTRLTLTSTLDKPVTIKEIKLNKGHCAFQNWELKFTLVGSVPFRSTKKTYVPRIPVKLEYGESISINSVKKGAEAPNKSFWATTQGCPLIRADIITDQGVFTLNF